MRPPANSYRPIGGVAAGPETRRLRGWCRRRGLQSLRKLGPGAAGNCSASVAVQTPLYQPTRHENRAASSSSAPGCRTLVANSTSSPIR